MLYILWGPDEYTISSALDELRQAADTPSAFSVGVTTLDGPQITTEQVRSVCAAAPFFTGKRLVIIRGLVEKFEPKNKQGKPQKGNLERREEELKSYISIFDSIPESTVVALVEGQLSGNNTLFKEIGSKAIVKHFPLMKEFQLVQWIQKRVLTSNTSISNQAVDSLVKLVGSNLWTMNHELEKLALFAGGRRIEDADVKQLVSESEQTDIFAMVNAILEKKTEIASQRVQNLLIRGAAPTYLLFMLSRQIRFIIRARELKKQGASEAEIQNRLGLPSSFAVRKTLEQSNRYSKSRLRDVYNNLLNSDIDIKTGKYDGDLAILILVSEICGDGQIKASR